MPTKEGAAARPHRYSYVDFESWRRCALRKARLAAGVRDIEFTLTDESFNAIIRRADGRCEVTGIPFSFDVLPNSARRPWIPSLDRKDSSKGYTADNTRIVCWAANSALGEWGEEVLRTMALAFGRQAGLLADLYSEPMFTPVQIAQRWQESRNYVHVYLHRYGVKPALRQSGTIFYSLSQLRWLEAKRISRGKVVNQSVTGYCPGFLNATTSPPGFSLPNSTSSTASTASAIGRRSGSTPAPWT